MLPKVGIIVVNYNYGNLLSDALNSAQRQVYPNCHTIYIDDASTDNSWSIACKSLGFEELSKNYQDTKRTLIRLNKNVGPSEARNIAIEATKNFIDLYCILDADDVMYSMKVHKMVDIFKSLPDVGVVYADYDILNTTTDNLIREYKEPFSIARLAQECIVHSGAMISKEALLSIQDENGFYDRNMRTCEDYDLWLRICKKFLIIHLAESLTLVRVQPQNSSLSIPKHIWEQNWYRAMSKFYANV